MDKPKYIDAVCQHHGLTGYILEGRGSYRCRKCRVEKNAARRDRLKRELIDLKGGACQLCGYNRCLNALQFHHRDPSQKDFEIGAKLNWAREKLIAEVQKCDLLCANCHVEAHSMTRGSSAAE